MIILIFPLLLIFSILIISILISFFLYFTDINVLETTGGYEENNKNPFDDCKIKTPDYIKINQLINNDFYVFPIYDERIKSEPKLKSYFWRTKHGLNCFEVIYPETDKSDTSAPNEMKNVPIIVDILKYNGKDVGHKKFSERLKLLKIACKDTKMDFPLYNKFNHNKNYGEQFKKIIKSSDVKKVKCIIFKSAKKTYYNNRSNFKWVNKDLLNIYFSTKNIKEKENIYFDNNEFPIDELITDVNENSHNKIEDLIGAYRIYYDDKIKIESISTDLFNKKNKANNNAKKIWIELNKGLTINSLLGDTIDYMKKLHRNASTKYLFTNIENDSSLLDIGAGRGNYFHMWKDKNLTVYAVEPNPSSYRQLLKKKKLYNFNSLMAYGQENAKINKFLNGKQVNVITFIYSLTFFFENEKTLNNLVELINESLKNNGILLGQVMDGKRLLETMNDKTIFRKEKGKGKEKEKEIFDCPPFKIELLSNLGLDGRVKINIDDPVSLVHDQWEYIVSFDRFIEKLKAKKIFLKETGFLDKESELLNRCPNWFTKLSRWFIFKKKKY